MCRLVAYIGHDVLLEDVLIRPSNSLLAQSLQAKESQMPTNGDGFGFSWYNQVIDDTPGLFVSVFPAWNDANLRHLTAKLHSSCFMAHVRAASTGRVSSANCHPFIHQQFSCMHNGSIGGFVAIKRHLRHLLDDEIYHCIKGETDSEHFFALFLQNLKAVRGNVSDEQFVDVFRQTISQVLALVNQYSKGAPSFLNICITDGERLVASRVVSDKAHQCRSLHFSVGDAFEVIDGTCHMKKTSKQNGAVVISSERLTNFETEWHDVPENHIIFIDKQLTLHQHVYSL